MERFIIIVWDRQYLLRGDTKRSTDVQFAQEAKWRASIQITK